MHIAVDSATRSWPGQQLASGTRQNLVRPRFPSMSVGTARFNHGKTMPHFALQGPSHQTPRWVSRIRIGCRLICRRLILSIYRKIIDAPNTIVTCLKEALPRAPTHSYEATLMTLGGIGRIAKESDLCPILEALFSRLGSASPVRNLAYSEVSWTFHRPLLTISSSRLRDIEERTPTH